MLITPYRPGLESVRLLRSAFRSIGIRARIRRPRKYSRGARAPVINWGNSRAGAGAINPASAIAIAADKIRTFRALTGAGIPCPEWTTDPERARELWGEDRTLSRLTLRGRAGAGIVPGIVPGAPLFVRAYRKRAEFRAHVIGGRIALIQRKRRKNATPPGGLVWAHGAGYVFSNRLGDLPGDLETVAIGAVAAIGLDFGAVDIIDHRGRAIVLEVNTAPGLSPSTAAIYSRELAGIIRG